MRTTTALQRSTGLAANGVLGRVRTESGSLPFIAARSTCLPRHHGKDGNRRVNEASRTSKKGYLSSTGRCVAPGSRPSNVDVHHGSRTSLTARFLAPWLTERRARSSCQRVFASNTESNSPPSQSGIVSLLLNRRATPERIPNGGGLPQTDTPARRRRQARRAASCPPGRSPTKAAASGLRRRRSGRHRHDGMRGRARQSSRPSILRATAREADCRSSQRSNGSYRSTAICEALIPSDVETTEAYCFSSSFDHVSYTKVNARSRSTRGRAEDVCGNRGHARGVETAAHEHADRPRAQAISDSDAQQV